MCQIVSNNNLTRTLFLVKSNMRENWQLSNDFERLGNYDPAELFDTYFSIVCCQQYATSGRHIIIGGQPSTLGNKNRQTFVIFLLLKIKFPKSMYTVFTQNWVRPWSTLLWVGRNFPILGAPSYTDDTVRNHFIEYFYKRKLKVKKENMCSTLAVCVIGNVGGNQSNKGFK